MQNPPNAAVRQRSKRVVRIDKKYDPATSPQVSWRVFYSDGHEEVVTDQIAVSAMLDSLFGVNTPGNAG